MKKTIASILILITIISMFSLLIHVGLGQTNLTPNNSFETTGIYTDPFWIYDQEFWMKANYQTSFAKFNPTNVKIESDYLKITVPATKGVGGQLDSLNVYGFGTYSAYLKPPYMLNTIYAFFMYYQWNGGAHWDEIDIEFIANNYRNKLYFSTWKDTVKEQSLIDLPWNWDSAYHKYTIVYASTYVDLYIDETLYKRHTTQVPTHAMHVLFTGYSPNYYTKAPTSASTMYVDWATFPNPNWVDYWKRSNTANVLLDSGSQGSDGSNSIKITGSATQNELSSHFINVNANQKYALHFYIKMEYLQTGGIESWISWYDGEGNYIGGQWVGGQWLLANHYRILIFTPTASWIRIHIYATANSVLTAYIDDVWLVTYDNQLVVDYHFNDIKRWNTFVHYWGESEPDYSWATLQNSMVQVFVYDELNYDYNDAGAIQGKKPHVEGYFKSQMNEEIELPYNIGSNKLITQVTMKYYYTPIKRGGEPNPIRGWAACAGALVMVFFDLYVWDIVEQRYHWLYYDDPDVWGEPNLCVVEMFNRWSYDNEEWVQIGSLDPRYNFHTWVTTHDCDLHSIRSGWIFTAPNTWQTFEADIGQQFTEFCLWYNLVNARYRIAKGKVRTVAVAVECYLAEFRVDFDSVKLIYTP